MNRKVLNEVALASAIGAVFGVVVAIVLVAEFGLAKWATLVVAGFAGALAGGVCYRPAEVGHVIIEIGRGLLSNLVAGCKTIVSAKPLTAAQNAVVVIIGGVKRHRRTVWKVFYIPMTIATFVLSSRLTFGWFLLTASENAAPASIVWGFSMYLGFIAAALGFFILTGFSRNKKAKPAWWMPIMTRVSNWLGKDYGANSDSDVLPKFSTSDFFLLWGILAVAPAAGAVIVPLFLVATVVDVVTTLILALASTERLASMAGALIGTVAGSICYFCEPSYLPAIIIGALIGGLSGRWLYALRHALVYKDPKAVPA